MGYWERILSGIKAHIRLDCASENNDYCWINKGIIVADDETGEILEFVKERLGFDELKKAGKINEIVVTKSFKDLDDCRQTLFSAARNINHGLLVINVSHIGIFNYCWCLKQLGKQEGIMVDFDGYVLLVIKGFSWDDVVKYANEHDGGQFDAMLQFYRRVILETK